MIQTALGMMGQTYQPDMTVKTDQLESAMGKLRATFSEYGLGASTGIDLPEESTGFIPKDFDYEKMLEFMGVKNSAERKVEECKGEIAKMESYAKKALQAGNESDARMFLQKKETLNSKLADLEKERETAVVNAEKMKEMHDKLASDIQKLSEKRSDIKAKLKDITGHEIHLTVLSISELNELRFLEKLNSKYLKIK